MTQPIPWHVPAEVADAPDEVPGGYRYDADEFYTGDVPVELLEATPHAKSGSNEATSIKLILGAAAPKGQAIRWDEYLGLDLSKEFSVAQQKAFLNAFAPGYLGSDAHKRGEAVDLSQLPGRWALAVVKKEVDTYGDRPPRHKPRTVKFLQSLPGPTAIDANKVKVAQVEIPQHGGVRGPAPGARPPRPAGAPAAAAPGARPAPSGGMPARPSPPPAPASSQAQQQSFAPPPASHEDADLPY